MDQQIENQKGKINFLLQLILENPDLRVIPMVESSIVDDDTFAWWSASWGGASVDEVFDEDDRFYIRSIDEEELINDAIETSGYDLLRTHGENEAWGKEQVNAHDWEKVIIVYIRTA